MARAAIICTVQSKYIPMVLIEQSPRKLWEKPANKNRSKCTASVHALGNRLSNMAVCSGTSIREFANEICTVETLLAFAVKTLIRMIRRMRY